MQRSQALAHDIRAQLVADIKAKARRDADDPETPAMPPTSKDESQSVC